MAEPVDPDHLKVPTLNRSIRAILSAFLIALHLGGCASAPPALPLVEIDSPRELIRRVLTHTDTLRDARIRSRVSIEIDGVRQKATSILFFRQTSDLKMEVNGTLGISIMSAKFWEDSLSVYLPGDNGYIDGPAARVLYQVTGMNLGFYDIQSIILGIPTLSLSDAEHVVGFDTTDTDYVLDLYDGVFRRRIWCDRRLLTVTREDILDTRGDLMSQLRLDRYTSEAGCLLPARIQIIQGANHISWSVESMRVNTGVDPSVFRLNMPPGVPRLNG